MLVGANKEFEKRVIPCSQLFHTKGEPAEWWTAAFLVDNLSRSQVGDYRILMNYHLSRGQQGPNSYEFDLILINRYGVFPIEVKHWLGQVKAFEGFWMQGEGKKHEDIFSVVAHKSSVLNSHLFGQRSRLSHLANVSVSGLIVLFNGTKLFDNQSKQWANNKNVLGLTPELKQAVSSTAFLHNGARSQQLSDDDIPMVVEELYRTNVVGEKIIGHYRFLKRAYEGDLFEAFQAEDLNLRNRKVRVKRYELQLMSPNQERAILTFQNSALALAHMEANPNIVQTFDYFPDPNRANLFYEITEWINGKRLDEEMNNGNKPVSFLEQKYFLKALCTALSYAHNENVYHRNIKPETIFITERNVVKLADFDFAKVVGDVTIHATLGMLPSNWRTAPELILNVSNASPRSDIYSLGALWYELALLPERADRVDIERITSLNLPEDARNLLKSMVSRVPNNRPANVDEISRKMDAIQGS